VYLDRYGCHKWLNALLPVINKFIEAVQFGTADKAFWGKCYEINPTKSITASDKVWGWICNFFPYIGGERREQFASMPGIKKIFMERGLNWKTF